VNHHQPLGTISLLSRERRFDRQDLALMVELARRASIAIDNARLYGEAQEATRVREDFISIAAHELRTPLTPLKLQVELVRRHLTKRGIELEPGGPALLKLIDGSDKQIDRLSRLVEDMLDTSRVATGQLTLDLESVDLSELVRELVERLQPELSRAKCSLELRVEPNVVGRWDRVRIEQVLINLLTNATKYGAGKPIELTVTTGAGLATIVVRDFGIGIAPEDRQRIFERFERAVSRRGFGGLGLGLYVARQIVQAHGGAIRVESEIGKGSAFIVELPLSTPAVQRP
jgi:signal transduction histidine kinase